MTQHERAELCTWLTEPLAHDVARSIDALRSAADVQYLAVMPDVHLATGVCIGVVLATEELVYPSAVGSDIGCGMAAIAFDVDASAIAGEQAAARVFAGLYEVVPSNKHRQKAALPAAVERLPLSCPKLQRAAEHDGRVQIGTLGRGNHFVEVQADMDNRLWLMVHSGSRGVGQLIARQHLEQSTTRSRGLPYLCALSEPGMAYLNDVAWARIYARENRLAMIRAIESLMHRLFSATGDWTSFIDSDHNHVVRETHYGRQWWIHRKGAQSADVGEIGMIPGSMGTVSFHVSGRGIEESLRSCSHGAGRLKSRSEARQTIGLRELANQMDEVWFDHRHMEALRDEAPSAYKDIRQVMRAQRDLVRIERELRPVLNYKGV